MIFSHESIILGLSCKILGSAAENGVNGHLLLGSSHCIAAQKFVSVSAEWDFCEESRE